MQLSRIHINIMGDSDALARIELLLKGATETVSARFDSMETKMTELTTAMTMRMDRIESQMLHLRLMVRKQIATKGGAKLGSDTEDEDEEEEDDDDEEEDRDKGSGAAAPGVTVKAENDGSVRPSSARIAKKIKVEQAEGQQQTKKKKRPWPSPWVGCRDLQTYTRLGDLYDFWAAPVKAVLGEEGGGAEATGVVEGTAATFSYNFWASRHGSLHGPEGEGGGATGWWWVVERRRERCDDASREYYSREDTVDNVLVRGWILDF